MARIKAFSLFDTRPRTNSVMGEIEALVQSYIRELKLSSINAQMVKCGVKKWPMFSVW